MSKAYLILENGKVFEGKAMGKVGETIAEVVFNTGMVGYLETLTDCNNYGQIVVQTFPMCGNYGVISEDFESNKAKAAGFVVREICEVPSNFRCEGTLDSYLKEQGVVGICGIDTRALTRILREEGSMNGMICGDISDMDKLLCKIKQHMPSNPVKNLDIKNEVFTHPLSKFKLALFNFGCGKSVINTFTELDCDIHSFSPDSTAEDIFAINPDGIIISDGPGDPKDCMEAVSQIKKLINKKIPMFGIGLGHQLIALAKGADTYKLHYGHRGSSGPCKNTENGVLSIITQNHGYCVDRSSLNSDAIVAYENANDKTIEGLKYKNEPIFTYQFRPEKAQYEKFIETLKEVNFNAVK
ncbi:MAG: glutamine-hydrolyzing carbamoyl-phosphate synthase small subunit [Clostridia bacterium]|nr:glutamine-hydrolyzing carbamoyl-phosphate synthase small subunit [Clostridia bacterium]